MTDNSRQRPLTYVPSRWLYVPPILFLVAVLAFAAAMSGLFR